MKNALTVDVEDWYMTQDLNLDRELWPGMQDRVVESTAVLLDMFRQYELKATFFVLGCVAEKHPEIVRTIALDGHEIASHGFWHQMVSSQGRQEFAADVRKSKQILEDLSGQEVKIYRAPSWSISNESLWALEVLEEQGFECDSSIQPFRTPLSGIAQAPTFPYHPIVKGRRLQLLEFPPTVWQVGRIRWPFAGGFYLRMMPLGMLTWGMQRVNTQGPGLVYIHPWELDEQQPRLRVSPLTRLTHYGKLDQTRQKLDYILRAFDFGPLGGFLPGEQYPERAVGEQV